MANEVTPFYAPLISITGVADEALTGGTVVGIAGDEVDGKVNVGYPAAAGGLALFVVARDTAADADVPLYGPGAIVPLAAGAAISAGAKVMADDDGTVITATGTTGICYVGIALADAADNVVKTLIMPGMVDSDDS